MPPVNSLILVAGVKPYLGFHYALEGGTTPPLQDVARAVANKIKSALPLVYLLLLLKYTITVITNKSCRSNYWRCKYFN